MNKNYYNVRNSKGQWTKQVRRAKNGRFASTSRSRVVAGRLYAWRNSVVRAGHIENGKRFVSLHKQLFGYVPESELQKIDKTKVNSYLANAH